MKADAQATTKNIALIHGFVAVAITAAIYFIKDKDIARQFLFSSAAFNLYIRLLSYNFLSLEVPNEPVPEPEEGQENQTNKPNPVLAILSSTRTFLIAAILAVFILKFKFNMVIIAASFITYKVVLLVGGLSHKPSIKKEI